MRELRLVETSRVVLTRHLTCEVKKHMNLWIAVLMHIDRELSINGGVMEEPCRSRTQW